MFNRRCAFAFVGAALLGSASLMFVATAGSAQVAEPTAAVVAAPAFTASFAPATITAGSASTLTFTIENSSTDSETTGLAFTDVLPTNLTVAQTPAAATTCAGGTVVAGGGSSSLALHDATVPPSQACTVTVPVTARTPGSFLNTSSVLSSSSGTSGPATATLAATAPLAVSAPLAVTAAEAVQAAGTADSVKFTKAFGAVTNGVATLTFMLVNSASADATAISFSDTLPTTTSTPAAPADMKVAATPNKNVDATNCPAGTFTAEPNAATVQWEGGTVKAGATCTLKVDVTATADGDYVNTVKMSPDPATPADGTATATLTVGAAGTTTTTLLTAPTVATSVTPSLATTGGSLTEILAAVGLVLLAFGVLLVVGARTSSTAGRTSS